MRAPVAALILDKTKKDYEKIADEFAKTRQKLWADLHFIPDRIVTSSKILDVGCGNGRLLESLKIKNVQYTGIDTSSKLISLAKTNFADYKLARFLVGDALSLPFENDTFDYVVSIAVLHHIPSHKLRRQVVSEMDRVLKKGGEMTISVWNLWQQKYLRYIFAEIFKKMAHLSKLDFKDCYIPWKRGNVINRYCHAFTEKELTGLIQDCGFQVIEHGKTRRGNFRPNIYAVGAKPLP